ncbi:6-phosphofructo-2-kinase/fructose-2,6-bisphosphatase-like isoform X4 [Bolinopsis microptera]|uniref:6-phosphofructo-2-kinase/fructose-2, 6-bisphosphatase-like isoform X4 n=1 Tax=Bolinopsis microptera TaxID=2820187 RepID=UPI00307A9C00
MVKKTEEVSSISKEMKVSNKEVHQYSSPVVPRRAMFEVQKQLAINTGKTRNTASGNLMETLGKERYTRGTPMSCAQQCYAMVGLPARGKSYIAHRLARYLNWIGIKSKVFNVGSVRRELVGVNMPCDYYDPNNTTGAQSRRMVASHVLDTIVDWFKADPDNSVAILDATNTTRDRRDLILEKITPEGIQVLFIESVLDDVQIEEMNIRVGTVQSKSAYFLMNIRPHTKTTLYLSRHGESQFNAEAKIGGDTNLTENGIRYAKKLGKFVQENNLTDVPVWTSIMKRTIETCSHLPNQNVQRYKSLNEIDAGRCDGLTYEEIEDLYPEEFALRDLDKYNYRYPQGESYQDICCRLEPIIMDLEKQDQILVICHQAVLRCVVGYFLNLSTEEIPYIKIPLHTVIKITPVAYGCEKEEITFGVDSSVNTHRAQPTQESIEQRLLALDVSIVDSGDICNSDSPVVSVNGNHSDLRT